MSRYVLISCIVYLYSLGIQAAKTVKTCKLSEFLHGFLKIISADQFRQLQRLHYPSLYAIEYLPTVNSSTRKMYYFILFGPLALCNASKTVTTSLYCFDHMGDLLLLCARNATTRTMAAWQDFAQQIISLCLMVDLLLIMWRSWTGLVLRTSMLNVAPCSKTGIKWMLTCSWRLFFMTAILRSFTRTSWFQDRKFYWTTISRTFKLPWTCLLQIMMLLCIWTSNDVTGNCWYPNLVFSIFL